jgi:hypothetical protein
MDDSINKTNLTSFIFNFFDISEEKCSIVEEALKKDIQILVGNLIDDIIGNKLIKDLETSRNEVINSIDKVNFLVKYEHDGQISGTTYTQLPLTGFVGATFYSEYSNVITYLNGTNSPFTQDLTHDLLSTNQYDTNQITSILSVLLFESKDKLKSMILKMVQNNDIFTTNDYDNMIGIIDSLLGAPTENDFKLDKFPVRKNDKAITYPSGTPSEIDVTDTVQKDNLNKILINKKGISGVTTLLNFYKG